MDVSDFCRFRPARPKRPLGTFLVRAKPPVTDVQPDAMPTGIGAKPSVPGAGAAPRVSPRRPVADVDPGASLAAAISSLDDAPGFGRMLPHIDEAYASLFGPDVWARHLQASGSGAISGLGLDHSFERWRFDLAPQVPYRRFDLARERLVGSNAVLRARLPADLVASAHGPWADGEFAMLEEAARSFALTDAGMFAGSPADWRFEDGVLTGGASGVARLIGLGVSVPPLRHVVVGAAIGDLAGEAFAAFIETARHTMDAIRNLESARRELGYHMDEPYGARLAGFVGGQLASFMYLCFARLPGFAARVSAAQLAEGRGADPQAAMGGSDSARGGAGPITAGLDGEVLPGLVLGGRVPSDAGMAAFARPVLGPAALAVAFEALQGLVPDALGDYGPCDLATGIEHLRHLAFAHVAIRARRACMSESAGMPGGLGLPEAGLPMTPEMAFWFDGVEFGPGAPTSRGLGPMLAPVAPDPRRIAEFEPADLIDALRAGRLHAGLDGPGHPSEASVAAAMIRSAGLRRLPAFLRPFDDAGRERAHAFKVGRSRRLLREREAAGHTLPERLAVPPRMPKLGSDIDEQVLRLVPERDCKPRVGPHPDPRGPYQLDEPEFMRLRRLRREEAAARAKAEQEARAAEQTGG